MAQPARLSARLHDRTARSSAASRTAPHGVDRQAQATTAPLSSTRSPCGNATESLSTAVDRDDVGVQMTQRVRPHSVDPACLPPGAPTTTAAPRRRRRDEHRSRTPAVHRVGPGVGYRLFLTGAVRSDRNARSGLLQPSSIQGGSSSVISDEPRSDAVVMNHSGPHAYGARVQPAPSTGAVYPATTGRQRARRAPLSFDARPRDSVRSARRSGVGMPARSSAAGSTRVTYYHKVSKMHRQSRLAPSLGRGATTLWKTSCMVSTAASSEISAQCAA